MRYVLRPWLPLDTYLAWRIKAALLCMLSLSPNHWHNPPSPLICFTLSDCDQLMSFFGLQLIMLMSPAQPKIRNYAPNPKQEVWRLISLFPLSSYSSFFKMAFPFLLPSSYQSSSSSLFPQSFFSPIWFFTPFPSSNSFNISPSPATSCWAY